jgi:glutathione S-transferase
MSTTVSESYHLQVPLERVWALIRPANFAYLPTVVSSDEGKAALAEVGAHRTVTYKDGTIQTIRITGLSDLDNSISWELEVSAPATTFTAQTHTVRLRRVTEGNTTFIEWSTLFSADASIEVLQDAKYKQADNFAALARALGVPPSQPRLSLFYFPARGRAEVSRLLLAQAGLAYDDIRLTREQWAKKKPGVAWGQMPLLAVDGKEFAQSNAIERYIARIGGLAGSNASEWLQIDSLTQALNDAKPKFVSAVSPFENKTEEEKAPKLAAYFANDFKKWTPFFSKTLSDNKSGSGFFVGSKVSYADIALFNFFSQHKAAKADAFADFPVIESWLARVAALPRLAEWLKKRPATPF